MCFNFNSTCKKNISHGIIYVELKLKHMFWNASICIVPLVSPSKILVLLFNRSHTILRVIEDNYEKLLAQGRSTL
jgi:hypothetical protein